MLLLTTAFSCNKDDDAPSPSTPVSTLVTNLQNGNWKIVLFKEDNVDETYHYTDYQFQFGGGGAVTATKSGSSVSGSWSAGTDDDHLELVLNFATTIPFEELNDDWHVTAQTATQIVLQDVSGGGGGTDYLTFHKM